MGLTIETIRATEVEFARDKDQFIGAYGEEVGKSGLLESWASYARRYPERVVERQP